MVQTARIPLFPLRLVLFPGMPLPLHIFEDRYRRLLRECMEDKHEFGILLQDGENLAQSGCTAGIDGVIREYEDGRFDVIVSGRRRFRVKRLIEEEPLLSAEVEFFTDEEPALHETAALHDLARQAAEKLMSLAATEQLDVEGDILLNLTPVSLSLMIGSTELFTVEEKQELLEMRSTAGRLASGIEKIGIRLRQRQAEKKIEELLGAPLDLSSLKN